MKKIMFNDRYGLHDAVMIGTQTEQKKFIGNAVEVHMSTALCEALAARLNEKQ